MARDAVVLEQALRLTKVAKGSFVEVWEVGSGFCWTTARASRERSCSATRGCATRSPTPACWGRQPAFFGEAPLRRRVVGHERGAGLRVLNFGPSSRARGDRVLEKCGLEVSHRCTRPRSVSPWQLA